MTFGATSEEEKVDPEAALKFTEAELKRIDEEVEQALANLRKEKESKIEMQRVCIEKYR